MRFQTPTKNPSAKIDLSHFLKTVAMGGGFRNPGSPTEKSCQSRGNPMNTAIMMMAMYNAKAIIDTETVARDWFKLSVGKFHEKIRAGEIRLPLVLMEEVTCH
jgi:hypothetical protein